MNKPFFSKDPEIQWCKVFCSICSEPCGAKSECYRLLDKDEHPPHKRTLQHPQLGILPIFSENCVFRQENLWKAQTNYPVSNLLIQRILDNVVGLERLIPIKKFTFQIAVGNLFDEMTVKSEVNRVYKSFIKEMQAEELSLLAEKDEDNPIVGILFPNGQQVKSIGETLESRLTQELVFKGLLDEFPDAKPIHLNGKN